MTPLVALDQLLADLLGLRAGVDVGTWPSHDWLRTDEGEININASSDYDHNGPQCVRCAVETCMSCQNPIADPQPCTVGPRPFSGSILAALDAVAYVQPAVFEILPTKAGWQCTINDVCVTAATLPLAVSTALVAALADLPPLPPPAANERCFYREVVSHGDDCLCQQCQDGVLIEGRLIPPVTLLTTDWRSLPMSRYWGSTLENLDAAVATAAAADGLVLRCCL